MALRDVLRDQPTAVTGAATTTLNLGAIVAGALGVHVPGEVLAAGNTCVGAWLLVAVEATSLVRHRLPTKAWRWIHLSSYATFVASTLHLFTAGSDTYGLAIRSGVVLLTGAVALLSIAAVLDLAHTTPAGSADLADRPPTPSRSAGIVG